MKLSRVVVAVFMLLGSAHANADLSPKAQEVKDAFERMQEDPSNKSLQLEYLREFPGTHGTFMAVFMPPEYDQLYPVGYKYIRPLPKIAENFPEETLEKLFVIEADMRWMADSVGALQNVTLNIALKYPEVFGRHLSNLESDMRAGVIRFLADGISGPDPSVDNLADRLEGIGKASIAKTMRHEAKLSEERADHAH